MDMHGGGGNDCDKQTRVRAHRLVGRCHRAADIVPQCPYEAWWELAITPVSSCSCPYMPAQLWEERATRAWQQ
eukprot:7705008-Prorocentrum_lima.AAC.1